MNLSLISVTKFSAHQPIYRSFPLPSATFAPYKNLVLFRRIPACSQSSSFGFNGKHRLEFGAFSGPAFASLFRSGLFVGCLSVGGCLGFKASGYGLQSRASPDAGSWPRPAGGFSFILEIPAAVEALSAGGAAELYGEA